MKITRQQIERAVSRLTARYIRKKRAGKATANITARSNRLSRLYVKLGGY